MKRKYRGPRRLAGWLQTGWASVLVKEDRARRGLGALAFRPAGLAALALIFTITGVRHTQDAVANGDTRSISIVHMHTKESISITFKRNGFYDSDALQKLNWILRDWRADAPTKMDPRLFDIAWEVHREVGSSQPFHVVSAYRSPGTNSMLRRRSRGVAKHSQHTMGKAMDFYLPDVSPATVRAVGMKLQRGGVGYYPSAYTPFIHLDVGSVRSWPRMTRDQLARIFPDGRTVHLPADGQPLAGYEVARAEILARGGSVGGFASADLDEGAIMQTSRRSLWGSLFGWNEEDESRPVSARERAAQRTRALAYAPPASTGAEAGDMYAAFRAPEATPATVPLANSRLNRRQRAADAQVAALPPEQEAAAPASAAQAAPPPGPAAARPRLVDAPLPTARPQGLGPVQNAAVQIAAVQPGPTAERLNWQQGPQGGVAAAPATDAPVRLVTAPLPPSRPAQMALAAALPGAASPPAAAPPAAPPVQAQAPASAEPRDPQPRLVAVNHPQPPERPRAVVASASASAPTASAAPPLAMSPPREPRPAPEPEAARPAPADRRALDNLFAAVATGSVLQTAKVTVSRPRSTQPQDGQVSAEAPPAAALGFSTRDPQDTRPERFSGPAVRPLPTTFTSR